MIYIYIKNLSQVCIEFGMYFVPFLNGVRIFISVFLKGFQNMLYNKRCNNFPIGQLRVSVLSVLTIGLSFSPADNNMVLFPV